MKGPIAYEHPEPVPSASQALALPFVASVAGYLVAAGCGSVRVTLHRVMTRDGDAYLQQLCSYAGQDDLDHSKAGRLFIVDEGIIGKAFAELAIVRTGSFDAEEEWWRDYRADRQKVGDLRPEPKEPISYLAVPFIAAAGDAVVAILYVEAGGLNRFVDGAHLHGVLGMAEGFRRMLDDIALKPLPRIRNYPLPAGRPVHGAVTLYPRLQQVVVEPDPPRFVRLTSYNFGPTV